jgi:hypothetical protein
LIITIKAANPKQIKPTIYIVLRQPYRSSKTTEALLNPTPKYIPTAKKD